MIAGRLELWTVFVFFMPDYWKSWQLPPQGCPAQGQMAGCF